MNNDDAVATIAHELGTSLRDDIDSCCHGLLGYKHHVELFILPEGYALNVARWQRKQCKMTQLRPSLFESPFPLEDTIHEVIGNIVDSSHLGYTKIVVERIVVDVYLERGDGYDYEQREVIHVTLKKK